MRAYRAGIVLFAITFVVIGIALLVATAVRGGGIGYLLGVLFVTAGAGRLFFVTRR